VRDRYLFSADRKASEYRTVLEITPGRARLLTPSGRGLSWRWSGSLAIWIGYLFLSSPLLLVGVALTQSMPPWLAWAFIAVWFVCWLAGLFLLSLVWDRKSLLFLADDPAHAMDIILLGARSFGAFQEVRARMPGGEEVQLVVDTRASRFWEAVRVLERNRTAAA
jgi:hypothetical protein